MKSSKALLIGLALALIAIPLFATGGQEGEDGGPVTLTYWMHSNQSFVDANQSFVDAYMELNPAVTVETEVFPAADFMQKLRTSFAAKRTSDVIQMFGSETVPFIRNELLEPVPEDVKAYIESNFYEVAIGAFRSGDDVYGIPREVNLENGGVLYYPEDLAEAGYDQFPATYDELIDAAQQLAQTDSDGNITHVGFDFFTTWNNTFLFYSFILQQGGDYWAPDGVYVDYTTPEAETALEAIVDLFVTHEVTDLQHLGTADTWEFFFQGDSSMCFIGPWAISVGRNEFDRDDFDYGLMPSFTGDSYAFAAETGWGEVVSAYSAESSAVWDFLRFITNAENARAFNVATSTIPSRRSVAEDPRFLAENPMLEPSLKVLPEGQFIGPLQNVWHAMEILEQHTRNVINGNSDVETALREAEIETNEMIDEQRAQ